GQRDASRTPTQGAFLGYVALIAVSVGLGVLAGSRRSIMAYGPIALGVPVALLMLRSASRTLARMGLLSVVVGVLLIVLSTVPIGRMARQVDEVVLDATQRRTSRALGFFTGEYTETAS